MTSNAFSLETPRGRADPGEVCRDESLPLAASDSPRGAVLRLLRAYCQRDLEAYAGLLTEDFRFETLDPQLAALIPGGLDREDEVLSARHLFFGGESRDGVKHEPVRGIQIRAHGVHVTGDPDVLGDPERHRVVLVDSLRVEIGVESPTWLMVQNGCDEFHMVRGDVAFCAEGERADADHWFVRRWIEAPEDESQSTSRTIEPRTPDPHLTFTTR
jgi:hypothetical protein